MVGIITPFYSENCGTILQAVCLFDFIKGLGYTPVFINTKTPNGSHSAKKIIGRTIRCFLILKWKTGINYIKKYKKFSNIIKRYPVINFDKIRENNIHVLIVGSDTVWNLQSVNFTELIDIYWPVVNDCKVISYAASVANSTQEDFQKYSRPIECLKKIDCLSVRDSYSKKIIETQTDRVAELCCDPTFLYDKEYFNQYNHEIKRKEYIFVYLFEKASKKEIQQIKQFAKKHNLSIVSYGVKLPWADDCIVGSIENFISYYQQASYIVTNTFHGTVFSIIFNKPFVCLSCNKRKIEELLNYTRLIEQKNESLSIECRLNCNIVWNDVNQKITNLRERSIIYLKNSLQLVRKNNEN